jgi:3-phenylpropionate/cinnamic acid dioxygenase small subunit
VTTAEDLLIRAAIQDTMVAYATATSTRDWDRWLGCFAPGATCDYTTAGGVAGSADEARAWLEPLLAGFDALQFTVSNTSYCEMDADRWATRTEFQTVMRVPGDKPMFIRAGGHYDDVFVRVGEAWLIAERNERFAYAQM